MHPLGVGLVYLPELDSLFREDNSDLTVLEFEPEPFWEKLYPDGPSGVPVYYPNAEVMTRVASLPQHKIIHSVGFPVGGTQCSDGDYIAPLTSAIENLDVHWASEHLSFNTIETPSGVEQVGFLLPPRQTREGVDLAARNIQRLAAQISVPFAFETGVNYLKPCSEELSDGAFFAQIAETADCGILLDLHNLWANERNGRQSVEEALKELPLERVWEVHLAGGMMLNDYYLDAHCGAVSPALLGLMERVMPRLPNVGALIFEILPGYIERLGIAGVRCQIALLKDLWKLRPNERIVVPRDAMPVLPVSDASEDVIQWERDLGMLAVGRCLHEVGGSRSSSNALRNGSAIGILHKLISEARSSRISRALHFTMILILVEWGAECVQTLIAEYENQCYPDIFASGEADRFACFLHDRLDRVPRTPYLREVLTFEHALLRASIYGERSTIHWEIDPVDLFAALEQGRVPAAIAAQRFAMEIVPQ